MVSDRLRDSSHNTLKYDGTTKSKEHSNVMDCQLIDSIRSSLNYCEHIFLTIRIIKLIND